MLLLRVWMVQISLAELCNLTEDIDFYISAPIACLVSVQDSRKKYYYFFLTYPGLEPQVSYFELTLLTN